MSVSELITLLVRIERVLYGFSFLFFKIII